jgi:hypothetical protein
MNPSFDSVETHGGRVLHWFRLVSARTGTTVKCQLTASDPQVTDACFKELLNDADVVAIVNHERTSLG